MIIYQIELTNHCNSACPWCNNKTMKRSRGFMSWDTFKCVAELVEKEPPPERVLGLHHFGESLMHPHIREFLQYLKDHGISWRLSTNGRLLKKQEIRQMLLDFSGLLVISLENGADISSVNHLITAKMQQGSPLNILLQTFGGTDLSKLVPGDYTITNIEKHSWGNHGEGQYGECCFLNRNWVSVLWDGTIVSCCMDIEGEARLGHVANGYHTPNKRWRLCSTCEVVLRCAK